MPDLASRLNVALSGRYRVQRELGQGGMATVFLADDLKHQRQVALKVIKQELGAAMGAERFLAEIRTTANLQHPHILPLFDSGNADGMLYYVMPYIEGESLYDRLARQSPLPIDEAVRLAAAVASALDYAHTRGVVHRDIKPGNILLQAGEPLVADFGIALALTHEEDERLTLPGSSMGTARYMSPEQATGDSPVGPASDTYALGCVLYEMLTGDPPFAGSAQAIIAKMLTQKPVGVREIRDTVPVEVATAVEKAMARFPADRYESIGDFAAALRGPRTETSVRSSEVQALGDGEAVPAPGHARDSGIGALAQTVGRGLPSLTAVLAVLLAGIYLAGRVGETRAELVDLVATQVGFAVSSPLAGGATSTGSTEALVPFTQAVPARDVLADRIEGAYVPPAVRLDGTAYPGGDYASDIIFVTPEEGGTVQLDPLEVPVGTEIVARAAAGASGFEIVANRGGADMQISVRGPVSVTVSGGIDERLDFGPAGGRISVAVREDGFLVGFTPVGSEPSCDDCAGVMLNLPVSSLELSRVDETVTLETSTAQRVSTVSSGLLSAPGLRRNLQPSEVVRFSSFAGEIGRLAVGRDSVRLDAAGTRTTGLYSSLGGDLMPTRFSVMGMGQRIAWATGAGVFLLFLFLVAPRIWRRETR